MRDALILFVPNSLMAVAYVFRKLLDVDRFIAMEITSTILHWKYEMQMETFRVVIASFTGYNVPI